MSNRFHQILIFVALAMGGFAIGTTEFASMSLLPFVQRTFAVGEARVNYIISAYALGVVFGAPIITVVAARLSRKALLVSLMGVFALGNGLSALAPSFNWLIVFRFISGLPHGAYFGLASLVAASIVKPNRRTQAVGYVMLGLTTATIIGAPVATWLAAMSNWRVGYFAVTALALAACALIAMFAPRQKTRTNTRPSRELTALARPNVWLTLSIGCIGFGGIFAVYTYLTTTLVEVTHMATVMTPLVLALFGIGMTIGNMITPVFGDRAQMPTVGFLLVWMLVALLLFPLASHNAIAVSIDVFCLGFGTSVASIIQARLMDVAGKAQNLAASMNHVAFNLANALGPFLAGLVIAHGFGTEKAGYVGALLAALGLMMWAITCAYDRRTGHVPNTH